MNKFCDYKTTDCGHKLGYTILSGWQRVFAALDINGNIHTSIYWYYDADLCEYSKDTITISYPITTFCGYLKAIKVGVIRLKNVEVVKQSTKLPPLEVFILAEIIKRNLNK